jgi:hypothetical protein
MPAAYDFRNTETADPKDYQDFQRALEGLVFHYRSKYDYIILDAQAGSDVFAEKAISNRISDQVIIVSEFDPMSLAGVDRLKALFPEDLAYHRTSVLLNKMLPEFMGPSGRPLKDFFELAKYLSPLPWNREVVMACSRRTLALDIQGASEFTLAVVQTLRSMFAGRERMDLEDWLMEQPAALHSPASEQLREAKAELEVLRQQRTRTQERCRRLDILITGVFTLVGIVAGLGYELAAGGGTASRLTVALSLIALLFGLGLSLAGRVRRLIVPDSDDSLDRTISAALERTRRLTELTDLDYREFSRPALT